MKDIPRLTLLQAELPIDTVETSLHSNSIAPRDQCYFTVRQRLTAIAPRTMCGIRAAGGIELTRWAKLKCLLFLRMYHQTSIHTGCGYGRAAVSWFIKAATRQSDQSG